MYFGYDIQQYIWQDVYLLNLDSKRIGLKKPWEMRANPATSHTYREANLK